MHRLSLRCFGVDSERHRSNYGIGCVVAKLRIGAQFIDGARLRNFLDAVAVFPVFRRKSQDFGSLLQSFVDGIAGCDNSRPVRERYAIATVSVLMYEGDVVGHRVPSINPSANRLAYKCFAPCRLASPALDAGL